jgi:DNA polymerase III delta prime subunit
MNKLLILGPTGLGKTSSLWNLPPEHTGIINCDMKALPLKGWRKNYQTVKTSDGKVDIAKSNYVETNKAASVLKVLQIWETLPQIKTIVIDTITHLITKEYMTNTIGKDYKAYQALGKSFYDMIEYIANSSKNIIVLGHAEKRINETGDMIWEMKSHGKMITDLVPASYFTTVLMAEKLKDEKDPKKFRYVFRTQSEGFDPAKSPAWMEGGTAKTALEFYEDNNVAEILEKLEAFEITA